MMSIWNKYPNFTDDELRLLTLMTVQIFLESEAGRSEFSDDFLETPSEPLSKELLFLLQTVETEINQEQVQDLLHDKNLSTQICLQVLGEVYKYPELVDRISVAYDEATKKMDVTCGLLLVGALLILAIKLERIRWTPQEKEITFTPATEAIKVFLSELFKHLRIGS